MNEHIRALAEHYAMIGFTVLAPDIFWRHSPKVSLDYNENDTKTAFDLMKSTDFSRAGKDVALALQYLKDKPFTNGRAATLGYCMGGNLAFRAASSGTADATVSYYGVGISELINQSYEIEGPAMFHLGGTDQLIPAQSVEQIRQFAERQPNMAVHVYEAADHGFNCWARPSFDQKSAAKAEGRTLQFLADTIC